MSSINDINNTIVTAQNLTKIYNQQTVVDDISLTVQRGECCGILGPNGAGNDNVTDVDREYFSHPGTVNRLRLGNPGPVSMMRAQIEIVPQKDNLDPDFDVTQNLQVYGGYFGLSKPVLNERIPRLLEFASLENKATTRVPALSGGMQRRLSLARALINEPALLILDEPTTGLDPQARQLIWQRLRRLKNDGLTLILTTHYMEEAERLSDKIIIMDRGRILDIGSPRSLIEKYIETQVMEVHGSEINQWHEQHGKHLPLRSEQVGDTWFYYGQQVDRLLEMLQGYSQLRYLHRPANLEDVFLKLTGRELRDD